MDKECELQRIAAFRGHLEASINSQFAFLAGGLIAMLTLVATLYYTGAFDLFGGRLWGFIPFAVVLVGVFYAFSRILQFIKNQQNRNLSLIFELISKVEKGEPIPSLSDLEKKVAQNNTAL